MRTLQVIFGLIAITFLGTALAERGYYSAPAARAEHRAGAFLGNNTAYSPQSRGYPQNGYSTHPYGFHRQDPYHRYDGYRTGPHSGRSPDYPAYSEYARPSIDYHGNVGRDYHESDSYRPYNPRYQGHDQLRRDSARRSRSERSSRYGRDHDNYRPRGRQSIFGPDQARTHDEIR